MNEDYIATLLEHEKASIIFPSEAELTKKIKQVNSNVYDPVPLENLLLPNFGYTPLSDSIKSTTIPAHSTVNEKSVAFNSCLESTAEMTAAGCAQSTSAAPTYCSPNVQSYNKIVQEFVDGGMTENNPIYQALLDLDNLIGEDRDLVGTKINVLSIGTGSIQHWTPHGRAPVGVSEVFHALLEGAMLKSNEDAHEKAVSFLGSWMQSDAAVSYYRLNPELDVPIELDDASEENLAKLRTLVYESILTSPFYTQLVEHLAGNQEIAKNQYVKITGKSSDQWEEFRRRAPHLNSMRRENK